jgi:hypothetical protein
MAVAFESTRDEATRGLSDGALLAGRYRVLHRTALGWLAYDERLSRPVLIVVIGGDGEAAQRVRNEASTSIGLLDAVISGDEAFAVRPIS